MASPAGGKFPNLILALRWATIATGAAITFGEQLGDRGTVLATALLFLYNGARTVRPLPRAGIGAVRRWSLALELAVGLAAVSTSGGWDSPYVLSILVGLVLAGASHGYRGGLVGAGVAGAGLGLAALAFPSARSTPEAAAQVILVYVATGVVAGYARRLFLEAEERQEAFSDRMSQLMEANTLLTQLTHVTQTLPSSLDLGDTLASAIGHLRELFDFDGAAILVLQPATDTWLPEAVVGRTAPPALPTEGLPSAARAALNRSVVVCEPNLDPDGGRPGLWPESRSALYGPLLARHRLVALAVLESDALGRFGPEEAVVMAGLAEPMAMAIDNALWFARLRTLGAEGERDRLARNLHDRIGQGLAYVGMELDRIARLPEPGPEIARLRSDVTALVGEVRETLRQLRSRVTESAGLAALADAYLPRFAERTGIAARFGDWAGPNRLPVRVEQELWRILQESLSNVERHSGATTVDVEWTVEGTAARLEVIDNGRGFDPDTLDDLAPSGIMAMRERANAVGARLRIDSPPGKGTHLVVEVEVES